MKFKAIVDKVSDETLSPEDREFEAKEALSFANNYRAHLARAMAAYDPDALPDDLPTLQDVLIERLEAVAMQKVKSLKSVLSQQGVDLPESCADEASAMRKIAEAERLGSIEIEGSESIVGAQSAYDDAVKAVKAVRALNIPIWYVTRQGVRRRTTSPTARATRWTKSPRRSSSTAHRSPACLARRPCAFPRRPTTTARLHHWPRGSSGGHQTRSIGTWPRSNSRRERPNPSTSGSEAATSAVTRSSPFD